MENKLTELLGQYLPGAKWQTMRKFDYSIWCHFASDLLLPLGKCGSSYHQFKKVIVPRINSRKPKMWLWKWAEWWPRNRGNTGHVHTHTTHTHARTLTCTRMHAYTYTHTPMHAYTCAGRLKPRQPVQVPASTGRLHILAPLPCNLAFSSL